MNKQILHIAIPSIVTNITVPLLGMVDISIAGHIGTATVIGAISVGGLIFNMVYWLFNFLRMGTSGLTAQAYGRESGNDEKQVLLMSLTVAFLSGVLIIMLQRPVEWLAQAVIAPTDDVWQLATTYFRVRVWAAPAVLALFALNGWFVGMQNSRYPMFIAIGQNLLNIAASASLVFLADMGIAGVALGTVISQYAGLAAALLLVTKTKMHTHTDKVEERIQRVSITDFFKVNGDIFLRMVCLIAVTTAFTSFGARQGDLLLAVNTLLIQLFILFSYFCDGFALAGEALVGKYVGAEDTYQKKKCVRNLFIWASIVVVGFTMFYMCMGKDILMLLTDDAEVIQASEPYRLWVLLIPLTGFAAFMWDGIFVGATASRQMLYTLMIGAAMFFTIWWLPLPISDNHHLWLAFILYLTSRSIAQTILARKVL